MNEKEKLIKRFMDFSTLIVYDELRRVLELFGYEKDNGGHSSDLVVRFINRRTDREIGAHRSYPRNETKRYVKRAMREHLETEGYL